jgi:hypothetical protein
MLFFELSEAGPKDYCCVWPRTKVYICLLGQPIDLIHTMTDGTNCLWFKPTLRMLLFLLPSLTVLLTLSGLNIFFFPTSALDWINFRFDNEYGHQIFKCKCKCCPIHATKLPRIEKVFPGMWGIPSGWFQTGGIIMLAILRDLLKGLSHDLFFILKLSFNDEYIVLAQFIEPRPNLQFLLYHMHLGYVMTGIVSHGS